MSSKRIKWVCIYIPVFILVALIVYDTIFLYGYQGGRKSGLDYVQDVRVMNGYLGHLLVVLTLVLGFFGKDLMKRDVKKLPSNVVFSPIIIAIIASCLSLVFIPVSYETPIFGGQLRWLFSLICQQSAIIFTCVGLITIIYMYREE